VWDRHHRAVGADGNHFSERKIHRSENVIGPGRVADKKFRANAQLIAARPDFLVHGSRRQFIIARSTTAQIAWPTTMYTCCTIAVS
jgi:hypothetical protein